MIAFSLLIIFISLSTLSPFLLPLSPLLHHLPYFVFNLAHCSFSCFYHSPSIRNLLFKALTTSLDTMVTLWILIIITKLVTTSLTNWYILFSLGKHRLTIPQRVLSTVLYGGSVRGIYTGDPCQYLGSEILQENRIWGLCIAA